MRNKIKQTLNRFLIVISAFLLTAAVTFADQTELSPDTEKDSWQGIDEYRDTDLIAYSNLDGINKYGNVILVRDNGDEILHYEDLEEAEIDYGDRVEVRFLDQTMEMPIVHEFGEVEKGEALMRVKGGTVELALNLGDFASLTIADKSTLEDDTVVWSYKEGIEGPVEFRISLVEKGNMEISGQLS